MYCSERMRLLDRYSAILSEFQQAVNEMRSLLNARDEHTFQKATSVSERLRVECEQARIELDGHVVEHGCGVRSQSAPTNGRR